MLGLLYVPDMGHHVEAWYTDMDDWETVIDVWEVSVEAGCVKRNVWEVAMGLGCR